MHTKRRNRLNTERMNDLVYIMYNRKLKQKFVRKTNLKEDDDPLVVENVMSDDEWIDDPNDDNEDDIRVVAGGGGASGEASASGASRKRKSVEINLTDEEFDDDLVIEDYRADENEELEDDANYVI